MRRGKVKNERAISVKMPHGFVSHGSDKSDELVLILHGYMQDSTQVLRSLEAALPESAQGLALDGPFPLPQLKGPTPRLVYAWYFFEPGQNRYLTSMSVAIDYVLEFLEELEVEPRRVRRVVGFSQGGYLAPFVALKLPQVKQVVGIGARFRHEELETLPIPFRMDSIHGQRDEVVEWGRVNKSHQRLRQAGIRGDDCLLKEAGHRIEDATVAELKRLLLCD